MFYFTPLERRGDKLKEHRVERCMTQDELQEVRRDALMIAVAVVQRYQNANWRRLRVNDICADLKRLIEEEANWPSGNAALYYRHVQASE